MLHLLIRFGPLTSLVTMCIALVALGGWRRTLRALRISKCINAAFHVIAAIKRYKALESDDSAEGSTIQDASDRLLSSLSDFDRTYTVARRYRPDLPSGAVQLEKIAHFLDDDSSESKTIEDRAGVINALGGIIGKLEAT